VGEAMNDAEVCVCRKSDLQEIIPVLDLPRDELESFASAVTGRFRNPYIKHQLLSIALNGMTKYRTRILPQLLAGQKATGKLPARLTFALAALIAFYRAERKGKATRCRMMLTGWNVINSCGHSIATSRSAPVNW
jgi:tagaturonate reductase